MSPQSKEVITESVRWIDVISNAIIFREKLMIVLSDNPVPCEYHPYYLLTRDEGLTFILKGYRTNPKVMLNFDIDKITLCKNIGEEFQIERFPEYDRTSAEVRNGYKLYTNIHI